MADRTIRRYRNDSDTDMDVPGVGPIPAGEAVSVVTEHQPTVILENYPGLVDVHEEEAAAPAIEPPVEGEPSVEN